MPRTRRTLSPLGALAERIAGICEFGSGRESCTPCSGYPQSVAFGLRVHSRCYSHQSPVPIAAHRIALRRLSVRGRKRLGSPSSFSWPFERLPDVVFYQRTRVGVFGLFDSVHGFIESSGAGLLTSQRGRAHSVVREDSVCFTDFEIVWQRDNYFQISSIEPSDCFFSMNGFSV